VSSFHDFVEWVTSVELWQVGLFFVGCLAGAAVGILTIVTFRALTSTGNQEERKEPDSGGQGVPAPFGGFYPVRRRESIEDAYDRGNKNAAKAMAYTLIMALFCAAGLSLQDAFLVGMGAGFLIGGFGYVAKDG
jgi:hypothetical protein